MLDPPAPLFAPELSVAGGGVLGAIGVPFDAGCSLDGVGAGVGLALAAGAPLGAGAAFAGVCAAGAPGVPGAGAAPCGNVPPNSPGPSSSNSEPGGALQLATIITLAHAAAERECLASVRWSWLSFLRMKFSFTADMPLLAP